MQRKCNHFAFTFANEALKKATVLVVGLIINSRQPCNDRKVTDKIQSLSPYFIFNTKNANRFNTMFLRFSNT